ncbi:SGS domain-containing protein [Kalaharituber pfeilii]|nr:SGS domain-containing protein [Kalaharituber pfeilii]
MGDPAKIAHKAAQALNAQDYATAIKLYTDAIHIHPTAPDYYIKRSTAYQRSAQYEQALVDAELAVKLAHDRCSRESIGQAQLRRGISCYLLEKYGDAGFCFNLAKKSLGDKEKSVDMWASKVDLVLRDTEKVPEDDIRREVTIKEVPDVVVPKKQEPSTEKKEQEVKEENKEESKEVANQTPKAPPTGVITPREKIRNEWYQTPTHVVFTLYVKGVPKDEATVEIEPTSISVSFPLTNNTEFTHDLDPLFAPVDPINSSYSILSTKIEIKLAKANSGQKWAALEGVVQPKGKEPESSSSTNTDTTNTTSTTTTPPTPTSTCNAPAYPTSSKKGPKNWDKVANELTKKNLNDPNALDDDYEEEDPVNAFFKKLYKDSDPDTQRAMMKSYIESNGTALSTNWAEVGKKKVETTPPEGMVAKKWDE